MRLTRELRRHSWASDAARVESGLIGDPDVVLEHAVQMFRLLGGGVSGDTPAGLPKSRLAILPGTSHTMMVDRAEMLVPMLSAFLDAQPGWGSPGPASLER